MKCFLLKNFHKVWDIQEHEMEDFKKCVLNALELVDNIYLLNLNSSNTDTVFLGEIFDVLIKRNNERNETNKYGPEILDMENLPIKDDGIELICKYFDHKCKDTKWIKIGNFYGYYQMSSSMTAKIIDSLEQNEYILKLDIEIPSKYLQHSHQKDKIIKRNEKKYREQEKNKNDGLMLSKNLIVILYFCLFFKNIQWCKSHCCLLKRNYFIYTNISF